MRGLSLRLASQAPAWFAGCDTRLRVIVALLFVVTVVSLQQPSAQLAALLTSLLLARAVRLPWRVVFKRLLAFEAFMLVLLLTLPFSVSGEIIWSGLGLELSREGLERALQIVLRANAVVIALLALLGTLEPEVVGHALARLKMPTKLVQLLMLSVRYQFVLFDEYQRLRQAMRVRAFEPASNVHTWRSYGWLVGMLLVRSLERSRRIYGAMRCRGYHGSFPLLDNYTWQRTDSVMLIACAGAMLGLFWLEAGV